MPGTLKLVLSVTTDKICRESVMALKMLCIKGTAVLWSGASTSKPELCYCPPLNFIAELSNQIKIDEIMDPSSPYT